jgi:hypothetical protein
MPLADLLNLASPADWHRVLIWLLAALRPHGPYPILVLRGPAGSGKSLAAHLLRTLIDPVDSPLLPLPFNERRLHQQALANHVLVYDNISTVTQRAPICSPASPA